MPLTLGRHGRLVPLRACSTAAKKQAAPIVTFRAALSVRREAKAEGARADEVIE